MTGVRGIRKQRTSIGSHRSMVVVIVIRSVIMVVTVPMVMGIRFVRAALFVESVFDPVHTFVPRA